MALPSAGRTACGSSAKGLPRFWSSTWSESQSVVHGSMVARRARARARRGNTMTATFSGRVALVAGGTGGLGHAVSLAFLEEGASVIVTYRRQEEFNALKTAAGKAGSGLEG